MVNRQSYDDKTFPREESPVRSLSVEEQISHLWKYICDLQYDVNNLKKQMESR